MMQRMKAGVEELGISLLSQKFHMAFVSMKLATYHFQEIHNPWGICILVATSRTVAKKILSASYMV
jgi:hypothetical protein